MHLTREAILKDNFNKILCILRPTLIYGPGDTHNGYGPNRFINLALKNKSIPIFGNGEEKRDHIFVEDVKGSLHFSTIFTSALAIYIMITSNIVNIKIFSFMLFNRFNFIWKSSVCTISVSKV